VDLRTLADWTIKRRLQSISGVAEVLTIGGGVKQIQVQPNPNRLAAFGVTFEEVEAATSRAAGNATSGYLQAGPREIMVRNLGMTTRLEDIAHTVIKTVGDRPVLISDVAEVKSRHSADARRCQRERHDGRGAQHRQSARVLTR
jgi:Cu/Ag efflux pump CusA